MTEDRYPRIGDLVTITADYPNVPDVKGKTGIIRQAGRRGLFEFAIHIHGISYDLLFDRHEFEIKDN